MEHPARGKELQCTGKHICQLDLRGIADYRFLTIGFATLDNLRCWQENHLHTIEYSTLLALISLFNWPAQIIQSSAGGFPSNHIECLTSHHQLTKTCNQLCLANPTDKYARQWSSWPPARSITCSHIFQLDLLGTVDYTVFASWWCDGYSNLYRSNIKGRCDDYAANTVDYNFPTFAVRRFLCKYYDKISWTRPACLRLLQGLSQTRSYSYAGLLLAPAEGFRQNKELIMLC